MSYVPAKKNTTYIFYAGLVSRSTGQFQANPTIAAGDFKVSIDGGALNNLATLPAVTPAASKMVKFSLSNTEMNGDNITIVGSDAAGAEWDDILVNIQTSVLQIDDLATPTNITAGTITTTTNLTNLPAAPTDWLTAAAVKADAVTKIQNGLATPTNITAGTITTVTNLTNAPTSGDFTAAMKTSLNAATPAVTVSDKTGFSLSTAGIQAIWDALTSALTTVGSIGKLLVDNIDATISSRLASASYTAPDNASITGIKTKTDQLNFSLAGNVDANLQSIDEQTTDGNNATLKLKTLNINNSDGTGLFIVGSTYGVIINSAGNDAVNISTDSAIAKGINIQGGGNAIYGYSDNGNGLLLETGGAGKSINAPNGILGSDSEDLSVTNITDKVWDEATAGHTTVGTTGKALTDAGSAGDPWGTNIPGAYVAGTAGYILGNNIDAKISDVKTKTDNLPANPAATSDIPSADITAIKAKTDQLTFTKTNELDANVQSINDTGVTGDGSTTPWGPA